MKTFYHLYTLKKCWCIILKLTVKYHEWSVFPDTTEMYCTGFVLRSHLHNNGGFVVQRA